jgi:SMODS-associating 4TM effector domain
MSTIARQQNTDESIRLLCAQSYLYSKAKQLRLRHTGFVIILAVLSILFLFLPDEYKTIPAIIGGVVTLIGVGVEYFETSKTKQAAKVQEEFDTNLFKLVWNRVLVGNKVEPEFIRMAARKFTGDKDRNV